MKKIISAALITAMVLTSIAGFAKDYPQKFYDVPKEYWAFQYIAELVDRGAVNGYEDGSYKPDNTVGRAEWAKIMVVAANKPLGNSTSSFNDMADNHWANPYVNAAKQHMTSYEGGVAFRPDIAAIREDVTVVLVKLKGYDVENADFSYTASFTDQDSISASCRKYVAVAVENGLINGFDDGTFRGQGTLTRAEAATLLWRAFQKGNDDKVVDAPSTASGSSNNVPSTPAPGITPPPSPTPTPSVPVTPMPEPVETSKPYTIDTVTKAAVENEYLYTTDNSDNIYYVDKSVNKVIKVNIYTKQKEDVVDISAIKIETDEADYSDFKITNLYYDNYSGKLLAKGSYNKINGQGKKIEGTYELPSLELITDKSYNGRIIGKLNSGDYITSDASVNLCVMDSGFKETVIASGNHDIFTVEQIDTEIYYTTAYNCFKYDFNKIETVFKPGLFTNSASAIKGQKVFAIVGYGIGYSVKSYNLLGKPLEEIDQNDMKAVDMLPVNFSSIAKKFIITPKDDFVYYDKSAGVFRIISKSN